MRVLKQQGDFRAKAIAGTRAVLIALDCAEPRRHGLLGFAFKREVVDAPQTGFKSHRLARVVRIALVLRIRHHRLEDLERAQPDPLVCTGSANFSPDSLLENDENMLLIRGDTRVADIYLTEFDRIFRHFYFRDVANEIEAEGGQAEGAFLAETSDWTDSYFKPGAFKTRRREMFFTD